jgi:phosphoglucosamine mutase
VLAAVQEKQKTLNDLLNGVEIYPQVLINVKTKPDYNWQNDLKLKTAITNAEQSLLGKGRVLIRASGTEPVLRVMVEANEAGLAQQSAEAIAGQVNSH